MGSKHKKIVLSALFTAIIAVISQASVLIPSGVPVTLQVFAIALCGYVLGTKWSIFAVLTYILAGAVGLPVFSGFRGGIQQLFSATGGFIAGFVILAALCGLSANSGRITSVLSGLFGLLLCHFVGILQFSLISGVGFFEGFLVASLPFLIKDIVLVVLAWVFFPRIKKITFKMQ